MQIGVGLVGYGGMGAFHVNLMKAVPELVLRGVAEPDPARRAQAGEAVGVATYASLEELLDDPAVELVTIVTPHDTHAPLVIEALEGGRHVLVEKVMACTLAEADAMIAAAGAAGRTLTVFQNRRWDGDYLTARQIIESGALGEVYQIEVGSDFYGPQEGWRARQAHGGGVVYDAGAHVLDQLTQLAGCRAQTVFATMQRRVWTDTMDTETQATITVRFESGLLGVADFSGIAWHRKPRWLVMGERGWYVKEVWDESPGYLYGESAGLKSKAEVQTLPRRWEEFYAGLAKHLAGAGELLVRPEQVRESLKIMEGAFRSAETGQSVEVLDW